MVALPFDAGSVPDDVFDYIAGAVEQQGYIVIDGALPPLLRDELFVRACSLSDEELNCAGIGRQDDHRLNPFVRRDETRWLEPGVTPDADFLAWMEQLRLGVNRRLFLGLFAYEAHYARYAPGAFYKKHLDAFDVGVRNRVLSTVLYLNPAWGAENGGEMVIYDDGDGGVIEVVQPLYGRLAVFLSERCPHEVLPTGSMRYSIAGWFRVNNSVVAGDLIRQGLGSNPAC